MYMFFATDLTVIIPYLNKSWMTNGAMIEWSFVKVRARKQRKVGIDALRELRILRGGCRPYFISLKSPLSARSSRRSKLGMNRCLFNKWPVLLDISVENSIRPKSKSKAPVCRYIGVVRMDNLRVGEELTNYLSSKKGKALLLQPSHLMLNK